MKLTTSKRSGGIRRILAIFGQAAALTAPIKLFAAANPAIPFEHIVVIIQENHSFDNYFGTFPGANGIPAGTKLPKVPGGPKVIAPFLSIAPKLPHDLSHMWRSAALAYDNGAMDGFYWSATSQSTFYYGSKIVQPEPNSALVQILKRKNTNSPSNSTIRDGEIESLNGFTDDEDEAAPGLEEENYSRAAKRALSGPPKQPPYAKYALCYYDDKTIPNYWQYATHYTLCDNFFSSLRGPSQPNHLYSVAAQSGGLVYNLNRSETAVYNFPTLIDLLQQAGITWKYYTGSNPRIESLWNPLPGFSQYKQQNSELYKRLVDGREFYSDIRQGTLPQVSWIVPDRDDSEHPPKDITVGMWYVTRLVNAIMRSSYWSNTCIIVFWDDYGGFYDHVPPMQTDEFGFGFRVPCLVISPYSRAGTVVHTLYDETSPLKLIETKFLISALTDRDSASNTMEECFNFNQSPLPPLVIKHSAE
jgi:phospholipase C